MLKELKNLFFIIAILLFIFFNTKFYFSDDNKKNNFRSLKSIDTKIIEYSKNIPLLKNDTKNIIEFVTKKSNENNKTYQFWDLLKNNEK